MVEGGRAETVNTRQLLVSVPVCVFNSAVLLQEVLCDSLQLRQLDQTVLSGVSSRMWTDVVQGVYQDFLRHVTALSQSNCDPTDPDDQVTAACVCEDPPV